MVIVPFWVLVPDKMTVPDVVFVMLAVPARFAVISPDSKA